MLCFAPHATAAEPKSPARGTPRRAKPKDPYKDIYAGYVPSFLAHVTLPSVKRMELSTEPSFFTLNMIHEDSRANALVKAALEKEQEARHRDALKMYQIVIDRYPHQLYRVSKYGVFVPVSQYCQRRILNFPRTDLAHYRMLHDARAKESFEQARRKHSLIGLSEIVDRMLATSYGSKAIAELGNAALDSGHYLAALERFTTIRNFFPRPEMRTPELNLAADYCRKMLGAPEAEPFARPEQKTTLTPAQLDNLRRMTEAARHDKPPFHSQSASAPHAAADDYTLFPPTDDPLAIREPVWQVRLPGSRHDFFVYTQPVVTQNSVIYRHKNIVYCRSILTGEPRWINDLGGRATWQNWRERMYPQEDLLVQDGLVFATISSGGPSLVALDEVTGQVKWAYGPMVASTAEEARMRFEAAPAGGPMTVFAGYILDNIEGETHTDSEYGVIAFESTTGRVRWRKPICRLAPGKFAGGFAEQRRNRIRSFLSPPLYHQGTVYYNTNAGAVAALDALSGRIKWLMRYPYHSGVHDATRQFGKGGDKVQYSQVYFRPHNPMFWYNQRPLIIAEQLYVLPVDSPFLLCLERGSGKARWSKPKDTTGTAYLVGSLPGGELVLVYTGRNRKIRGHYGPRPVQLVDPKTGRTVWGSDDLVMHDPQPVMKYWEYVRRGFAVGLGVNHRWWHEIAARPFLTADGRLYVTSFFYYGYPLFGHCVNLGVVSLNERKIIHKRRFYSGELLAFAAWQIATGCPTEVRALEELPHKDSRVKWLIKSGKEVINDTPPENRYPPFLPFSRVTFRRHGVLFEVRLTPRRVAMIYDRDAVKKAVAPRTEPDADFTRAELALADSQLDQASALLKRCLVRASSEDLDFRALVKQQLFRVHKRLARSAVRAGQRELELANGLGMSRTGSTLAEEIETLFALADAYERQGQLAAAARCLRSIVSTYGHHEYPVAPVTMADVQRVLRAASEVIDKAEDLTKNPFYSAEMTRSLALSRKSLPLYFSTVSPLPKPLTVRAGELAAARLMRLRTLHTDFAAAFDRTASDALARGGAEDKLYRMREFPGTAAAQKVLDELFAAAGEQNDEAGRKRLWALADLARVSGLKVPEAHRARVTAPDTAAAAKPVTLPQAAREADLADPEGINWLVLERRGDRSRHPQLLVLGGRVRKRLDNKFLLNCFDLRTGKPAWTKRKLIRLKGTGQEPGFFHAFAHGDILVVHGLYDVLAYDINTAALRWRYRAPFDFEIKRAIMNGDLLILTGKAETIALYIPASSPAGEVAWQVKERGDLYIPSYFHGDRLVSVRKMPFNVTVRYRATGELIGRLELPDLLLHDAHPLIDGGPRTLPAAHNGKQLVVSDGWYYVMLDIETRRVVWKRLIDNNDLTRLPALRFALKGDYFAVLKEDYDQKAIYMLSSRTGRVLWHTAPKDTHSPQPMHSMFIDNGRIYGIGVYPGQGFYFVGRDCKTGRRLFRTLATGYDARPVVRLIARNYGGHAAVMVQDRQRFEVQVFDLKTGGRLYTLRKKGVGPFGVHGRVSATVQHGRVVLLSKDSLSM